MRTSTLTQLPFYAAGTAWLETRRDHISPRTFSDYSLYLKQLSVFFGEMRLHEITPDMVRAYQKTRRQVAGPGAINKELGVLKMMRERIGIPLQDYQRLQQPKDWESPGRALSDSEEEIAKRVCKIIAESPAWKPAALAALLSMSSGMTRREMLSLKLKDCNIESPTSSSVLIRRRGDKRVSRERLVVLAETGTWCLEQLVERAMDAGCADGDHFLFPRQNRDKTYDPTQPAQSYRAGMKKVFELTGIKNFTPHSFRHHAVSRALSNPSVPLQGAVRHFGWINPKMINRYYHESVKESSIVARAIEARGDAKPVQKSWVPKGNRFRTG